MDSASNGNTSANEQPKSAGADVEKKPEVPVVTETTSSEEATGVITSDSENKNKEVQDKDALLGFVCLPFLLP